MMMPARACSYCGGYGTWRGARGLCHRCYTRWWHAGKTRVGYVNPVDRRCIRCGLVVPMGRMVKARCRACYQYWHRTGRDRPERYVLRVQLARGQITMADLMRRHEGGREARGA